MSRKCRSLFALVGIVASGSIAVADAPLVFCQCSQGEFHGPRYYAYFVDAISYPMIEFRVGTNDLDPANYTNVTSPPGWQFAVEPTGLNHACGLFSYHGEPSLGVCDGITTGCLRWWTDDVAYAVELFTFEFEHPWRAEDVGWMLTTQRPGPPPEQDIFFEDWGNPVGMGCGPLHGPYAEPQWCWSNDDCDPNQYCFFEDCYVETGMCLPRPQSCPWVWDPVCGCDCQTYSNACTAAAEGMSLAYLCECLVGDLDLDADVDVTDLAAMLSAYGSCVGDPHYFPAADIDGNGCVELYDLAALLGSYGATCP
jgi:hypothetical protein